jgi:hypothetical protein
MAGKILSHVSFTGVYERKSPTVTSGTIKLESRAWNDNDGLKFNTGSVVAVGECLPNCTTIDFYVETNIVFLGSQVLAQDLGLLAQDLGPGTSIETITDVPPSGYNLDSQNSFSPELGKVFAFLLPDRTFGIIGFTQIAVPDLTNQDVTYCTVKYKYQSNETRQF